MERQNAPAMVRTGRLPRSLVPDPMSHAHPAALAPPSPAPARRAPAMSRPALAPSHAGERQIRAPMFNTAMPTAYEYAGSMVKDLRLALGWPQRTLAAKAAVDQSLVSLIERGRCPDVPLRTIDKLLAAMGARLILDASAPFLANSRQRDLVHATCTTHVARRLERVGWQVATEVEIGDGRSRGGSTFSRGTPPAARCS